MRLGIRDLVKEFRVVGVLVTFETDTLLDRPSTDETSSKAVLLIPGFMASDATLFPLARRLRQSGHRVFFAGIWFNADCPARVTQRLEKTLRHAHDSTGAKVTVIGHSLGGVYARELARSTPDLVERAILLGAPLKHPVENSNQPIRTLVGIMEMVHRSCLVSIGEPCPACGMDFPAAPPEVPETIIYTKSDGVVEWESCLESGPNVEALEVSSSHCGLSVSVEAWEIIRNRLDGPVPAVRPGTHGRAPSIRPTHRFRPSYLKLVKRDSSAA